MDQNPSFERTGYLHPYYAESLREFGKPLHLPHSGGWVLAREIPGTTFQDAMGCYPLCAFSDWSGLDADLRSLAGSLVSLALVTDPFGKYDPENLKSCFDLVARFKEHHVCELGPPPESFVSRHHRYYARKSLQDAKVEVVGEPLKYLDEWIGLYSTLTKRHGLTGIKAFSRDSFARQLEIPGMVMLRMTAGEACIGGQLWLVQNGVAYSHLTAFNEMGYAGRASYGLHWRAIEIFKSSLASKVNWLDFGAGAGISGGGNDGLSVFKQGWSTATRPVWFCGRILDRDVYESLVQKKGLANDPYFPLYRKGEFG